MWIFCKDKPNNKIMIQSKQDYNYYLERDRVASGIPPMNSLKAKIRQFFFPSYEWQFIKALRWLEYCENVKKNIYVWGGNTLVII